MAESLTNDNNTCVVCFKNVVYYSIGECDHPVCYECSTRMRVLCLQNECPICRQALSRVVFTDTVHPYKELRTRVFTDRLFERQFKIGFCCEEIKQAYEQLLENRCKMCGNIAPFRTFSQLSDHMRKVHERYYCDLCVKHLKIFTSERSCYTRQELAHHRRKGDLDDTSHRGHPLCEFCEERFMDADELYRHLRKEHLYCHLCDADGKNLYYASHSALAQHFRTDHYLCEEGECAGNHLTAVFRTEIDLKAHKATVHGRGLARGAARQARTIELQFNITPHAAQLVPRAPRERDQRAESPPPPPPPPARIDTRSDAHFPRLSAAPHAPPPLAAPGGKPYKGVDGLTRNERNFPSLGGGNGGPASGAGQGSGQGSARAPAAQVLKTSKPSVSIQLHSQPASASSFRLTQTSGHRAAGSSPAAHAPGRRPPLSDDDFPSLSGAPSVRDDHPSLGAAAPQTPKVGLVNNAEMQALKGSQSAPQSKRAALSAEAFPALGPASAPAPAPAQWITVSKDKGKKHMAKTSPPPPTPREPAFNPAADFPTLPVNNKPAPKQKKTPQPQPQPQPPPQPTLQPSKKEKKKQNSAVKKENFEPQTPTYVNGYDKFTNKQMKEAYNAAINMDENNAPQTDRKIKTIEDTSTVSENRRNGGIGDFALAPKDYPPLSAMSANAVQAPVPQAYVQHTRKEKRANGAPPPTPPGFSGGGVGAGGACMTFTNSAGQTFPAPPHDYLPPPDFERRNRALVKRFADALGSAAAVEDFKVASRAFRDSIIDADEFYAHCERAMGAQLDAVFPDLVALLPDIGKQQELALGRDVAARLRVCATCGQLLAPADAQAHDTHHWPPLSTH